MSLIAIQNYHNELQNIKDFGGSKKETAIRHAFQKLLDEYAKQKGLMLIAELTIKSPLGNNITPDGTLKDSLRLDWGYWESKDEADDIDLEIGKKFAKGYPKDNILFEDSQTAVLYQNGMETARIDMKNPSDLDKLIKTFVNYERPEVVNFRKAIELFKSDIPNVANALRNLINEQTGYSSQGSGYSSQELNKDNKNIKINDLGSENDKFSELSKSQSLAGSNEYDNSNLQNNTGLSEIRDIRLDKSDKESSGFGNGEYSRRLRTDSSEGIPELSINSQRFVDGSGDSYIDSESNKLHQSDDIRTDLGTNSISGETIDRTSKITGSLSIPKPRTLNPIPVNQEFIDKLYEFHETCKQSINPEISLDDINEMMIQHILTADIFNTIFDEPYFHRENNIAEQLERVINTFFTRQIRENLLSKVNMYYQAINATAAGIADHHEKQKFLKIVYENFYKSYNPKAADRLGVVYTPNEIVRFMIESTDYLLHKHFGRLLADKNVEILDPATGTGTFICDMIDYLPKDKLEYKYKNEIHANEVAILPYYIANLNIEFTYKQRMGKYEEFQNLCFVDTLDNMGFRNGNHKQDVMWGLSAENTERIIRQNEKKISVIMGNPPYNANQMNENENNKNRTYTIIDERIKNSFVADSEAQKTKTYDMYSRFYRWSIDRLGNDGIIAFITNRSFINSKTYDGFRKAISKEFDFSYIVDLGGDMREKDIANVFDIKVGVAIMFLVRKQSKREFCNIQYYRVFGQTKDDKYSWLSFNKGAEFEEIPFTHIIPDVKQNWINQDVNNWDELMLLYNPKNDNRLFRMSAPGVSTNRDEWVYDFSKGNLIKKVELFIDLFKKLRMEINPNWDNRIKWSRDLKNKFNRNVKLRLKKTYHTNSNFRPFVKKQYYYDKILSDVLTNKHVNFYGKGFNSHNKTINIRCVSADQLVVLANNSISDLNYLKSGNGGTFLFPLNRFDVEGACYDNITDWGLEQFQTNYSDKTITKEDIFHYVYAVLHNPEYRKKYEMNLKREFPRIPFYEDFWKWAGWGKKLMDLHINFETVEEYQLKETTIELNKEVYKAKLKADKEAGTIELDNQTILSGIPKEAWEYKLGNRSALEWILDQYKEKKPKDPTIAEKFNTYRFIDYKDKVIDLIKRVTTVSVETVKIVEEMRKQRL